MLRAAGSAWMENVYSSGSPYKTGAAVGTGEAVATVGKAGAVVRTTVGVAVSTVAIVGVGAGVGTGLSARVVVGKGEGVALGWVAADSAVGSAVPDSGVVSDNKTALSPLSSMSDGINCRWMGGCVAVSAFVTCTAASAVGSGSAEKEGAVSSATAWLKEVRLPDAATGGNPKPPVGMLVTNITNRIRNETYLLRAI